VVAVKKVPGAEPIMVVGVTNKVKAGERVTINLSANNPWTRATTPQTLQ
jgi:copper(I)-binding protein